MKNRRLLVVNSNCKTQIVNKAGTQETYIDLCLAL